MATSPQEKHSFFAWFRSPSPKGCAFLLLATVVAAGLRFWQLGDTPPGLYRDEAFNGLDALSVLEGQHRLFFPANNGREPAYIYLTALSVAAFGRTALAVRLGAAVAGTLTTLIIYQLGTAWFGRRVGLFAAWVWAITLWPVHLSRIGLRAILLAPTLALAFWLGTLAYRRREGWLWLAAGVAYGLTFYTYLAARFTPLLLLALLVYLLIRKSVDHVSNVTHRPPTKGSRSIRDLQTAGWFVVAAVVTAAPLFVVLSGQPGGFFGRSGQVSIFNPAISGGDWWGTLWRQVGSALGMFLFRGDTILRHNPAGRPVFDVFMAVPFVIGVVWCLRHWRRPAAAAVLLWTLIMLGPTILAEDAPHFLRAVGVLPAAVLLPAVGLSEWWSWPKLASSFRRALTLVVLVGSLGLTVQDYFFAYGRQPDTAYLFEAAARELAEEINAEKSGTVIVVEQRFWSGWPSIPFLVRPDKGARTFEPAGDTLPQMAAPAAIYAWPHEPHSYVADALVGPAVVAAETGGLARGDLEPASYPLYVRYTAEVVPEWLDPDTAAPTFGDDIRLLEAQILFLSANQVQTDLYWTADSRPQEEVVVFVHAVGPEGLIGQSDGVAAGGNWPSRWWRPDLIVKDTHLFTLAQPFDTTRHHLIVGLYEAENLDRLPVRDPAGNLVGDSWTVSLADE